MNPHLAVRIDGELTRLLFRSAEFGLFSNFALSALFAWGIWDYFDHTRLLIWAGAFTLVTAGRVGVQIAHKKAAPTVEQLPVWRKYFITGSTLSAACWGAAGWTFMNSDDLIPRVLGVLAIAGLNAGDGRRRSHSYSA